jgi:hypothetical protein
VLELLHGSIDESNLALFQIGGDNPNSPTDTGRGWMVASHGTDEIAVVLAGGKEISQVLKGKRISRGKRTWARLASLAPLGEESRSLFYWRRITAPKSQ